MYIYSIPSIIPPPIFCHPHLTAIPFHLQKCNYCYISCSILPSFIHHPHYLPSFSPVPKVADNSKKT